MNLKELCEKRKFKYLDHPNKEQIESFNKNETWICYIYYNSTNIDSLKNGLIYPVRVSFVLLSPLNLVNRSYWYNPFQLIEYETEEKIKGHSQFIEYFDSQEEANNYIKKGIDNLRLVLKNKYESELKILDSMERKCEGEK